MDAVVTTTTITAAAGSSQKSSPPAWLYDGFLSHRVWSDKDITEKLYYALERDGRKLFWDKACLEDGAPWEEGFVKGLQKASKFIAIVSEKPEFR